MTLVEGNIVVYLGILTILLIASALASWRHMTGLANAIDSIIAKLQYGPALPGVAPSASGGGTGQQRADVSPWLTTAALPVYGQLLQTLPAVADSSTWYNDCGETCCSMVIRAARGCYVPGDELRVLLRGQGGNPLTTAADLVAILGLCQVHAYVTAWTMPNAIAEMRAATSDGRPVIALGTWPTPGGVLHWILVTSVDADRVHYHNPWGAVASWLMIADWAQYTANSYVALNSHLLYP